LKSRIIDELENHLFADHSVCTKYYCVHEDGLRKITPQAVLGEAGALL